MPFKIVAAAVVLLLVMALPALFALRLAASAASVAGSIAEDHAAAIAEVADGTRALMMRHALLHQWARTVPGGEGVVAELARTQAAADGHFAAALLGLRRGGSLATDPRDARDLGRMTLLFELAMEERRRLVADGDALLGANDRSPAALAALDEAQDRLITRLDQVKDGLRQVIERQAEELRRAEQEGRTVGLVLLALAAVLGLGGALWLSWRRPAALP